MRIEQLHIRNIASIAEADIDFIRDLRDEQDSPASLFLIAGETGTGKTVILDAITMALYKTTPRIDGVSAKQRNTYTDSETGETVGIFSIEQYTRIGIGPKDECYSELVFTGNDGHRYTSRLTLGVKRTAQLRTPEWLCSCDDGNSWSKDKDVREQIQKAVGLSFEQFCRLSMLAQGQFAEFLCGDRKQREIILEQLTRTEHFSRYGEAISLLYKEKKQAREELDKTIRDQLRMLLSDEQTKEKTERIALLSSQLEEAGKQKEEAEQLDRHLETLDKATDTLRQLTLQEQQHEQTWNTLSASLLKTKEDNSLLEHKLKEEQEWIDAQQPFAGIYEKEGELAVRTRNLENGLLTITKKRTELLNAKEKTALLNNQLLHAQEDRKQTKTKTESQQQTITETTGQRDNLRPAEVNKRINALTINIGTYNQLLHDLAALHTAQQSLEAAQTEQKKLMQNEEAQTVICVQREAEYRNAQDALDSRQRLYDLMKAATDKAFQSLRAQLQEGDTCPLCGGKVDMKKLQQNFQDLLDPLENERKQLTAARDQEKKAYETANNLLQSLQGQIKAQSNTITTFQKTVETAKGKAEATARSLNLPSDETQETRIRQIIGNLESELQQQLAMQKKAEELQTVINGQTLVLTALQKEYEKAEQFLQAAQKAADDNANRIEALEKSIAERNADNETQREQIRAAIGSLYPMWEKDIPAFRQTLLTAAAEYDRRRNSLTAGTHTLAIQTDAYNRMLAVQREIAAAQPLWQLPASPAMTAIPDAENRWNSLKNALTALHTRRRTCEEQQLAAQTSLAGWYDENGQLQREQILQRKKDADTLFNSLTAQLGEEKGLLRQDAEKRQTIESERIALQERERTENHWKTLNDCFGGTRLRTLVQTCILAPLLRNANRYLAQITNRYLLTCDGQNEQLSVLVRDLYNHRIRSSAVLSGGERFQISLALSLALSDLNRAGLNTDILFIDEGFGTLDKYALNSVMNTLQNLSSIVGQQSRRVGVISHREELSVIPSKILVRKDGRGRSKVVSPYTGEYAE